ncbi:hypothetical protein DN062_18225 [Nitrincola tibetensis]|uniref:DUF2846 domain-containing protein n=1 Tax=Nitrincola tibetensis TaxID=2219697 RepID=A0A364NH29_9GAMM|nr:hypothetical protein DN062_18225 [Nitrincola tibetensis]
MAIFIRICVIIAAITALTSCASVTTRSMGSFTDSSNGYPLSIERGGIFYNDSPINIFINGEEAAILAGRSAITIYVPAGRHIVAATPNNKSMRTEIVVDISATSSPILRTNIQIGGPRLEVISR